MEEGRHFEYVTGDPYTANPPGFTATVRAGDCKAKALWLYNGLGDGGALFVIGKTTRFSHTSHAWVYWRNENRWWILDLHQPLPAHRRRQCFRGSLHSLLLLRPKRRLSPQSHAPPDQSPFAPAAARPRWRIKENEKNCGFADCGLNSRSPIAGGPNGISFGEAERPRLIECHRAADFFPRLDGPALFGFRRLAQPVINPQYCNLQFFSSRGGAARSRSR